MGLVSFNGIMAKSFKDIGKMGKKMGMVNGDHLKGTIMRVNGKIIGKKARVFFGIGSVHIGECL